MPSFDSFILYELFLCLYEFHEDNVVTYYQRGVARKWHTWHMPPPPPPSKFVSLWPAQPPFLPVPDQVRAHPKRISRYATAYHTLFTEDSSWQQLYFESRLNLPNCWRSTMQPGYLAEDYWHQSLTIYLLNLQDMKLSLSFIATAQQNGFLASKQNIGRVKVVKFLIELWTKTTKRSKVK